MKRDYLQEIVSGYLYKDVLETGAVRNSDKLRQLLRLLAYQVGRQVSLTELGTQLQMSKNTVASYIDLLEKSFVVFRLKGYSRNLRKEVTRQYKIYFWDVGIRNALIQDLRLPQHRNDMGQVWENFAIVERLKYLRYVYGAGNLYFWRTHTGAELDLVEERDGELIGYECKWGRTRARSPGAFFEAYPQARFAVITPETFVEHLARPAA